MCEICATPFDLDTRAPLVLQCGQCITRSVQVKGRLECFTDRRPDVRPVAELPRNFALVDASKLDLEAAALLRGVNVGRQLWLDERELELSTAELGSGASGRVVEGMYQDKPVAVKLIDLGGAPRSVLQTLQREADIVLAVSGDCHHTCLYKGVTIKNNKFCLVMKKYDRSLAHVIADEGAEGGLPLDRVLHYSIQALTAIKELHDQHVVIVDMKPQNLLLNERLDELVVTDFGLSNIVSHTLGGFRPSTMQGTPNYMSPELFATPDRVTSATDMWSWAATVIHMATGRVPFAGLSLPQICHQVVTMRQGPAVPAHLPPALKDLLGKCLSHDPAKRPTAAVALQVLSQPVRDMSTGVVHCSWQLLELQRRIAALQHKEQDLILAASKQQSVASQQTEAGLQQKTQELKKQLLLQHADLQETRQRLYAQQQQLLQQHSQVLQKQQQEVQTQLATLARTVHQQLQRDIKANKIFMPPSQYEYDEPTDDYDDLVVDEEESKLGTDAIKQILLAGKAQLDDSCSRPAPEECTTANWTADTDMESWKGLGWEDFAMGGYALTKIDIEQVFKITSEADCQLPAAWSGLTDLQELKLQVLCRESPALPSSWSALKQLRVLEVHSAVGGSLPRAWSSLTQLTRLHISSPGFESWIEGFLPWTWSALLNMRYMTVNFQNITGGLPVTWSALTNLECLNLSYNSLVGELPEQWSSLVKLQILDMSSNQLSGPLPGTWAALSSLTSLDLSCNHLSGDLPQAWSTLTALHCKM